MKFERKDLMRVVAELQRQGWRTRYNSVHVVCYPPDKGMRICVLPTTGGWQRVGERFISATTLGR